MKRCIHQTMFFILLCLFTLSPSAFAAGLLKPLDGRENLISMKQHHVDVTINNGFARTEVDQIFRSSATQDLEALYRFPLPEKASLSEVSLFVDGKELIGEVLPKEAAQKTYKEQKAKGNQTALADQDTHKYFEVRVFPVRAQEETRVRLVYYQPLSMDLGIGRYVYPLEEGNVDDAAAMNFWAIDDKVEGSFRFTATLKSAYPVKDLRLPGFETRAGITRKASDDSHEEKASGEVYEILIEEPKGTTLGKDVVLYYRLSEEAPARVEMIPYKKAGQEGHFMLVVTPGGALQRIENGTDWTFVLDVSGSMSGEKIRTLGEGLVKTMGQMKPEDRFRVITFNNRARDFSGGWMQATEENIRAMVKRTGEIQAGGGTDIHAGLEMAYEGIDADRTSGIFLVTDGVANIGKTAMQDFLTLAGRHDVRLFTFVMGNSANRPLLESLAHVSGGFAMNVSTSDDIIGRILQAKAKVIHESLYNTRIDFSGNGVAELTPASIGNLYKGQQVVLFGKYKKSGQTRVTLRGRIGGEEKSWTCTVMLPEEDLENPEIERLWALSAIEDRMREIRETGSERHKKEVVDLAVAYSLVTEYTSMVVVKEAEKEELGMGNKNADRVAAERKAQEKRKTEEPKNRRVDLPDTPPRNGGTPEEEQTSHESPQGDNSMFQGARSPNIGSGPLGPLFIGLALLTRRRRKQGQAIS